MFIILTPSKEAHNYLVIVAKQAVIGGKESQRAQESKDKREQ